jgi:Sec7 domain
MDVEGRRFVAEEARLLLTSLRRGFPLPKLVEDLQSLRSQLLVRCPDNAALPFLNVIMDPRAAGPHTLAALHSMQRLLPILSTIDASELCKCILACKFEQTDSGVDEAVEMAIADVLAALTRPMDLGVHLDAFHTVFVTRQTFAHRPAIAQHLEEVLAKLLCNQYNEGILEFLIQSTDEQLLALRLIRVFLETHTECSSLIPDDLCLNILLTGQAVFQSPDAILIASEVCSVIGILWWKFRAHCRPAFAAIWSGFYTQLLIMLRKDMVDATIVTVILESLVDILGIHDHDQDWGTLKTLFRDYDCHMHQSNVATHLILELARCCGVDDSNDNLEHSQSTDTLEGALVEYSKPISVAHKKLCAQALSVAMQCLFRDDHPTPGTLKMRSQRKRSILSENDNHVLRNLKAKKRSLAKAARVFNRKASDGFTYMLDSGLVPPDQFTPQTVAQFLRNGLVVGLDKKAVGGYLGEAGKTNPHNPWDGVDFHKQCLDHYCALFDFDKQSVLDSLRMFLAAFRLPGEAQQIDRILQAFADRSSRVCEECNSGLFSEDMKKASDAAYLLSFSIIMLNTDLHNANIREDRKMKLVDFIKNNSDYGKDICDKPLPKEYLTGIYESISQEEIRTEGEGADGTMTVERWKDVLRHSHENNYPPPETDDDAQDMTELVVEYVWKSIVDAIGALWDQQHGNLLGIEGARLGMDMSVELMVGIRQLGRVDIFKKIFVALCEYTGLIGYYTAPASKRSEKFCNSLESQAAVIVVIKTAIDAGEDLDEDCWRRLWSMVLELRDLKLLSRKQMLRESDKDLLSRAARFDWNVCLENGDMDYTSGSRKKKAGPGLFGAVGRAIFGSSSGIAEQADEADPTLHQKELHVVWDDGAQSDCDMDEENDDEDSLPVASSSTLGAKFEDLLVSESAPPMAEDMPVTGLERIEDGKRFQHSMRFRVRERLRRSCDFHGLIAESRFMDDESFHTLLQSLVCLVSLSYGDIDIGAPITREESPMSMERASSDISISTGNSIMLPWSVPISPASEALIEVIICELSLKNKDRLKSLWHDTLHDHYVGRLTGLLLESDETSKRKGNLVDPGLEKRVTGLLRLSCCAVQRPDIADDILSSWKYVP